jgi:hypothetical protein
MAVAAERRGEIGAEPVTPGVALRIDALHGEAGQVLHLFSLSGRKAQVGSWCERVTSCLNKLLSSPYRPKALTEKVPGSFPNKLRLDECDGGDCAVSGLWCQEKRLQDIVVRLRRGTKVEILGAAKKYEEFR